MRAFDTNRRNLLARRPLAWYDRDFDDIFTDMQQWLEPVAREEGNAPNLPACDVTENEEAFLVCVDLPGVKKENINIGVDEGRLTITAEKVKQIDETTDKVRRLERRFGQFNRQFTLPEGIEADKIQADYEDGVLHIHIPKAEKGKAKTIKIGEGGGVLKRLINNRHVKEHTRAAND